MIDLGLYQEAKSYALGLGVHLPPDPKRDELVRFSKDSWSVVNQFCSFSKSILVASFGDWNTGSKHVYKGGKQRFSAQEHTLINSILDKHIVKYKKAKEASQEAASLKAQNIWQNATTDDFRHPYLTKKGIEEPFGTRLYGNTLLVPTFDIKKTIKGLLQISSDGKYFIPDQKLKGCFFSIGDITEKVYLCQSFATGCAIHRSTKMGVVCAFSAWNLKEVVEALQKQYPKINIIIASNNDCLGEKNTELDAAKAAGAATNVLVVVPRFKSLQGSPKDFGDLYRMEGSEELRRQLNVNFEAPGVFLSNKQPHENLKSIEENLRVYTASALGVFTLNGTPVKLCGEVSAKKLEPMSVDAMSALLLEKVSWYEEKKGEVGPATPNKEYARVFHANPESKFRSIKRVVNFPIYLPNDELISAPGYSSETYLDMERQIKDVPLNPSFIDVQEAKHLLLEVWEDFPFNSPADKAHIIAGLLVSFVRNLIRGPIPFLSVESPSPGTGKTLAANCIVLILLGRDVAPTPFATNEDERRKSITALLLQGLSVVLFDNIDQGLHIHSPVLAALVTSENWNDRLLGFSKQMTLPQRALWIMTGNNISYSFELSRRVIRSKIDANMERSWQRDISQFKHPHLVEWILENREDLIRAVLILVNHWISLGKPAFKGKSLGSFESWSKVIGGILDSSGIEGFLGNLEEQYEDSDIEYQELYEFCDVWFKVYEQTPQKPNSISDFCSRNSLLCESLGDVSPHARVSKLGKILKAATGRIFGPYKLERYSDQGRRGGRQYRVIHQAGTSGDTSSLSHSDCFTNLSEDIKNSHQSSVQVSPDVPYEAGGDDV